MFMFDKKEFKKLIFARKNTDDMDDFAIDIAWKNTINYVCQDNKTFKGFLQYIRIEMTVEEYAYLSEISLDLSGITVSLEFTDAFKSLAEKYPKETADYYIARFIRDAEYVVNFFLKEGEKVRADHLKRWFDDDPDFIEPYLTKKYTEE